VGALRRWWDDRTSAARPLSFELRDGIVWSDALELNATEHCNLACRGCSHLSPVAPAHAVDPEALARDLALLRPVYRTRQLRLVGGEPLLHPRLLDVVATVRASGVAETVALVTNGVLLARAPDELWAALDRVDVSLYPGKEPSAADRERCRTLAREAGTQLQFREVTRFRESHSTLGTGDDALVARIFDSCALRDYHTLADGRLYRCPQSYFLPKLLLDGIDDGLTLAADAGFGERLRAFLASEEPRASCRNCLGTAGRRFAHVQTRRSAFSAHAGRPTEELVDAAYLRRSSGRRARSSTTR
jgi:hypothetical protein